MSARPEEAAAAARDVEPAGGADAEHLRAVCEAAAGLLAAAPLPPAALRVRLGAAAVELDWAPAAAGGGAAHAAPGEPAVPAVPAAPAPPGAARAPAGSAVCAETVGVFYRAPQPGADPFVRVGDVVRPGQQLAIIEVMKLMIPVDAQEGGRIAEVCADDGASVEYGEPLFVLAAAEGD
ncbi:acetyl-CoA carboxylase biotin carboxyl carrier protein [Streptomonospora nanhaiensis]|uniref:acetyl-CoA carboxylase biotin carboxyl carrier protein n=1 Tax=Streptomonospora nanhaiensis TaxID=1323731 RepID=UPI001C38152E|nr:biotin/lipoyl-containing protein [Streptomonospora nanhaiensis]MBV2365253.1 acetyl-CoA carboxylase, biotin carboxyl carrier protein [Streptomonospora nanhaiensis]